MTKNTKTINNYRWQLTQWGASFRAYAQKRCTLDNGKAYFQYTGAPAEFDSAVARDLFLTNFTAQFWAEAGR